MRDHIKLPFWARKVVGLITSPLSLLYGTCGRCKRAWALCDMHVTHYMPPAGCFALCEDCWGELTPAERLPYYMALVNRWETRTGEDFTPVRKMISDAATRGG
jgi:hypothetical protein